MNLKEKKIVQCYVQKTRYLIQIANFGNLSQATFLIMSNTTYKKREKESKIKTGLIDSKHINKILA